jgi:hypothetical protein
MGKSRVLEVFIIKREFAMKHLSLAAVCLAVFAAGCSTPSGPPGTAPEKGPQGTIAYNVPVDASEPATKIEVNYQPVGIAPLSIKIFGDKDGTFHNFGSDEFVVRAYPARTNEFPQTKIFKTGAFSIKDDKIPGKIYFQFSPPAPPAEKK